MLTEKKTPYVTGREIVDEIKEGMKECKLSAKEPYTFEFHLYFDKAKDARAAERDVQELNLTTEVMKLSRSHACVGRASMKVDFKKFASWGEACISIAKAHHGKFDGWQMGPPDGAVLDGLDEDGDIDIAQLLEAGGLVIGSQTVENPCKHEVTITIPGEIEPIDRGELYEDPLAEALKKHKKLGMVLGGQSEIEASKKGLKIKAATIRFGTNKPDELIVFLNDWIKQKKFPKKTTIVRTVD
jgi:hypothetical protein